MHSLSALKWHVNLDNMFGISQRNIFPFERLYRRQCFDHTSLNSFVNEQKWHDIFVCFHFLDSK